VAPVGLVPGSPQLHGLGAGGARWNDDCQPIRSHET
jgi:hypothetical protein